MENQLYQHLLLFEAKLTDRNTHNTRTPVTKARHVSGSVVEPKACNKHMIGTHFRFLLPNLMVVAGYK